MCVRTRTRTFTRPCTLNLSDKGLGEKKSIGLFIHNATPTAFAFVYHTRTKEDLQATLVYAAVLYTIVLLVSLLLQR